MKTLSVVRSIKLLRRMGLAAIACLAASTSIPVQGQGRMPEEAREDHSRSEAMLNFPQGVAVDSAGNMFVADSYNSVIRKISPTGEGSILAGSMGVLGSSDGKGKDARFYYPQSIAIDAAGNLFVADSWNYTIRKITPGGVVSTLAGVAGKPGSSDGSSQEALFGYLSGIAVDGHGNVYAADVWNRSIRKITPEGRVSTLAGSPGGMASVDGVGKEAQFGYLSGLAVDLQGNVYVPDVWSKTIRKVSPTGMVTTLAGVPGRAGCLDGTVNHALFNNPLGIAVDRAGNIYVADQATIRRLDPSGQVTTLAGSSGNGGSADGLGDAARFGIPVGLAVDGIGNIYVADSGNYSIRKVTSVGIVTTVAGNGAWLSGPARLLSASPASGSGKINEVFCGP